MSALWYESLDMNMTYFLPILCILYVLLPRKTRTLPVTNSLKDKEDIHIRFNKPSSDNINGISDMLESHLTKETGIALVDDYTDDSRDHVLSSSGLNPKDHNKKMKNVDSVVPEYMMDLYKRLSRKNLGLSNSNIVRSFRNIDSKGLDRDRGSQENIDFTDGTKSHVNILTFNVSSISSREVVNLAELRVFTLIELDKNVYYFGVDRVVSLYDVITEAETSTTKYKLISSRTVHGRLSAWETFNVTSAVERWVNSGNPIHKIEIRLENVWWGFTFGSMDLETFPNDSKEPLLLVYSDDNSKHSEHMDERHELISHEISSHSISPNAKTGVRHNKPSDIYLENASEGKLSRQKRSKPFRRSSACRRRPMFVDFEDINWHTWIIAPRGYQAYQCVGKCFFPVSETLSPSKHAIIQSTLHSHNPKKAVRACCVPTKLDPISILYIDEQGVVTYKYHYDGMVVAECGCR